MVTTIEALTARKEPYLENLICETKPLQKEDFKQWLGPQVIYHPLGKGEYQLGWALDNPLESIRKVYDLKINLNDGWLILNGKRLRPTRFTK